MRAAHPPPLLPLPSCPSSSFVTRDPFARVVGGCYDVSEHFEYESRRGVEQVSMLEVACAPFHAHSPTLLLRQRPARLACDRVLLMHGERDVVVPPSSSALFAVELAKVGQQVTYVALPTDSHLSFLVDMSLGRQCALVEHIKSFCMQRSIAARL